MYTSLVAVLTIGVVAAQECSENFTILTSASRCVRTYSEQTTFEKAEATCNLQKAHLVSIHNAFVNAQLAALLSDLGGAAWIGLQDADSESPSWTDNTLLDYTNWNTGFPTEASSCAYMSNGGKWKNDVSCDTPNAFICEKNVMPFPCDVDFMIHFEDNVEISEGARVKQLGVLKQLVSRFTFSEADENSYEAVSEFEQVRVSNVFCDGRECDFSQFFTNSSHIQTYYDQIISTPVEPYNESILEALVVMSTACYDMWHEADATTRKDVPLVNIYFNSLSNVDVLFTGNEDFDPFSPEWFSDCTKKPIVIFTVTLENGDPQIHKIAMPSDATFDMTNFDANTVEAFIESIVQQARRACGIAN